jgi:hypothetical protein
LTLRYLQLWPSGCKHFHQMAYGVYGLGGGIFTKCCTSSEMFFLFFKNVEQVEDNWGPRESQGACSPPQPPPSPSSFTHMQSSNPTPTIPCEPGRWVGSQGAPCSPVSLSHPPPPPPLRKDFFKKKKCYLLVLLIGFFY